MDKTEFRKLIRECIVEVLKECATCGCQDHEKKEITNVEEGQKKCAWCGKDMGDAPGVTGVTHGMCPDCREKWEKDAPKPKAPEPTVNEMTGTGAVAGFMGKNWVDPDPKRKRMKSIAAKSVGGKVA